MASADSHASSMPPPPMKYVNMYTDENIKKGKAPKPPPPIKVCLIISCVYLCLYIKFLNSKANQMNTISDD